jgi:hypothetical protein
MDVGLDSVPNSRVYGSKDSRIQGPKGPIVRLVSGPAWLSGMVIPRYRILIDYLH